MYTKLYFPKFSSISFLPVPLFPNVHHQYLNTIKVPSHGLGNLHQNLSIKHIQFIYSPIFNYHVKQLSITKSKNCISSIKLILASISRPTSFFLSKNLLAHQQRFQESTIQADLYNWFKIISCLIVYKTGQDFKPNNYIFLPEPVSAQLQDSQAIYFTLKSTVYTADIQQRKISRSHQSIKQVMIQFQNSQANFFQGHILLNKSSAKTKISRNPNSTKRGQMK